MSRPWDGHRRVRDFNWFGAHENPRQLKALRDIESRLYAEEEFNRLRDSDQRRSTDPEAGK